MSAQTTAGSPQASAAHGYSTLARVFHWLTALGVLIMIPLGIIMTGDLPRSLQNTLYIAHKGLGAILLVLVAARVIWRVLRPAPPLPAAVPVWQRRAARLSHILLYLALVTMVISGYVLTVGGGFPIELLNALGVPPLIPVMPGVAESAAVVHGVAKWALMALLLVHIGASLLHTRRGDGVWSRMWPPWRPGSAPRRQDPSRAARA
jgi:cytochrome b561